MTMARSPRAFVSFTNGCDVERLTPLHLRPVAAAIRRLMRQDRPQVHLSFASKVLHTIDNDLPICDRMVKEFFEYSAPRGSLEEKILCACRIYDELTAMYKARRENGLLRLADVFSARYADDFSDVKKIDFMIWGFGRL